MGTVFQRASLILLVPLLLRNLSVAEYGAFGLLQSAMNLLPALITLNLPATITRLYFDPATPKERRSVGAKLTALTALVGIPLTALFLGLIIFIPESLGRVLGVEPATAVIVAGAAILGAFGSAQLQMALGLWRAERKALIASVFNVLSGATFLVVGLLLHAQGRLTLMTGVAALCGSTFLVGVIGALVAPKWSDTSAGPRSRYILQNAFHYGIPLLPYLLGLWVLAAGGRWIGRATLGLEGVAHFTLATQISTMIALLGRSSFDSWTPHSFVLFTSGRVSEGREYLKRQGMRTVLVTLAAVIAASLTLAVGLPTFAPAYAPVTRIFPLVAVASLIDVAYLRSHTELLALKRTERIAIYMSISILFFVVVAFVLSRSFGVWGLSGAYVAAHFVQWRLANTSANRAMSARGVDR